MREIPLTRGLVALVDDADYEALSAFKWFADSEGYAVRKIPHPMKPGTRTVLKMHRLLLGLEFGDPINGDHEDGNRANNQRYNIRRASDDENAQNKPKRKDNSSGFKGVTWHPKTGKWRACIRAAKKRLSLGLHNTPEAAHEAYKAAALRLHGEFANFGA